MTGIVTHFEVSKNGSMLNGTNHRHKEIRRNGNKPTYSWPNPMYMYSKLLYSGIHSIQLLSPGDFTVEFQWLEHLWNHEKMFETGVVRANEC